MGGTAGFVFAVVVVVILLSGRQTDGHRRRVGPPRGRTDISDLISTPIVPDRPRRTGGGGSNAPAEKPPEKDPASEAFEKIKRLVEAEELEKAESALKEARGVLAGSEFDARASELVASARRDARAKADLAEARRLMDEGKYDQALSVADQAFVDAVGGRYAERLKRLSEDIRKKIEEKEKERLAKIEEEVERERRRRKEEERRREAQRRAKEEKQRREAYAAYLALARERASREDFPEALRFLERARAEMDIDEVAAEIERVKFEAERTRARRLADAGDLDGAIAAYRAALAVRPDEETEKELGRLREIRPFLEEFDRAEKEAAEGRWGPALEALAKAKGLAPGQEQLERVEERIAEYRYKEAAGRAERFLKAGKPREALAAARAALGFRPGSSRAKALLGRARRRLFPPLLTNSIGTRLVLVPAGAFAMGSDEGLPDEAPAHEVRLGSYYIGLTEVTNLQYERFRPEHASSRSRSSRGDHHPVAEVSDDDAVEFCRWLSEEDGATYRLPTEAEWERAARGRDGREYPWGNEAPWEGGEYRANFSMRARKGPGRDGFVHAAPVGSYRRWPSAAGCLDMAGNVAEWCLDWYSRDYYAESPSADPRGPEEGAMRVVRGGSWGSPAKGLRATARFPTPTGERSPYVGFRVVRELTVAREDGGGEKAEDKGTEGPEDAGAEAEEEAGE
jgi:formylglycine-generating enzyme required for sulfatase activity